MIGIPENGYIECAACGDQLTTEDEITAETDGTFTHARGCPTDDPARTGPEECSACQRIAAAGGFGPSHDASPRCQSGGRDHCTCDTCF
ncbi:MAG: hypothetical protein NUW21_02205 [Elusimicrobia bacterium]|nr:hypothetical protein [Elusimicrobiota bacterium]